MGWSDCGIVKGNDCKERHAGYGIRGKCEYKGCTERIDHGLSYVCGDMHGGGDYGCGGYFCENHRCYTEKGQLCCKCMKVLESEVKALSIKQPWAWLICAGYKDIENRNWKIGRNPRHGAYVSYDVANFTIKLPMRIYVHAGLKGDTLDDFDIRTALSSIGHEPQPIIDRMFEGAKFGAIIGEVDITGCVTESKSPFFVGKYGFTLANPVLYDKPIPYKGQLGFFEVENLK
jgi:hypothetical protein